MDIAFLLKKIISAFIMPLSLGLILGVVALIYLFKNKIKKAKIFLSLALVWIALIGYAPFGKLFIKPLESEYKQLQEFPKDIKYVVLLGGDFENRAWEVLRIYNKIADIKIITTGYKGRDDIPEAIKSAKKLQAVGVLKKDIIIYDKPKDTKEEVMALKEVLKKEKFILVTSSFHLLRAMELFKKEGLNPIASTSHFLMKKSDNALLFPNPISMAKLHKVWHEYLGLLWAKVTGQI